MTFPGASIGDKGQRYRVDWREISNPARVRPFAYAPDAEGARDVAMMWLKSARYCAAVRVVDREPPP